MNSRRQRVGAAVLLLGLGFAADRAHAQAYPVRPLRMVVPAAPGGGTDFVARVLSGKLAERLGQPVVIDNRGGAGGSVGTELVARSSGDGYTLLMVFVNFAIYPSLYAKLGFDPIRDFEPVSELATTPLVLVVNPSLPVKSVSELIALAHKPGSALNYAAPGVGSLGHLAGELFKQMAGIGMTHVPYKGGGPAIAALLGGEVQAYFSTMPAAVAQIRAGRLRALAVTGRRRVATEPTIPTISESGLADYDVTGWFGALLPARTPRAIVDQLNSSFEELLASPEVKERFRNEGLEAQPSSPNEFAARIKDDVAKWAKVVKRAEIKPE